MDIKIKVKDEYKGKSFRVNNTARLQANIVDKKISFIDTVGYFIDLTITEKYASTIGCPFNESTPPLLRLFYNLKDNLFVLSKKIITSDNTLELFEPYYVDHDGNSSAFYELLN